MEIRKATSNDHGAIRSVVRCSLREADPEDPQMAGRLLEWRYAPDELDARLERPEAVCVLAEEDDEVVGFAEGTDEGENGRIEWLHVTPAHRGEGVGTELFEWLREELRGSTAMSAGTG